MRNNGVQQIKNINASNINVEFLDIRCEHSRYLTIIFNVLCQSEIIFSFHLLAVSRKSRTVFFHHRVNSTDFVDRFIYNRIPALLLTLL